MSDDDRYSEITDKHWPLPEKLVDELMKKRGWTEEEVRILTGEEIAALFRFGEKDDIGDLVRRFKQAIAARAEDGRPANIIAMHVDDALLTIAALEAQAHRITELRRAMQFIVDTANDDIGMEASARLSTIRIRARAELGPTPRTNSREKTNG